MQLKKEKEKRRKSQNVDFDTSSCEAWCSSPYTTWIWQTLPVGKIASDSPSLEQKGKKHKGMRTGCEDEQGWGKTEPVHTGHVHVRSRRRGQYDLPAPSCC